MFDRNLILDAALKDFGLISTATKQARKFYSVKRGSSNPLYIESAARLMIDRLSLERDYSGKAIELPSPVTFLSRIDPPPREKWFRQPKGPESATFSVVVGEYGLGKTELLFCLAEAITSRTQDATSKKISCLPIALASCAGALSPWTETLRPDELVVGLLRHLVDADAEQELKSAAADILDGIRGGEIVLLLDALDELVSDMTEHRIFLESVGRLAEGIDPTTPFHVVVSTRLEHLLQVDAERLGDMTQLLSPRGRVPVCFLLLDFFDDATAEEYIAFRLKDAEVPDKLSKARDFRDILRRPLLVKLLCDTLERQPNRDQLLAELKKVGSPAGLLELVTEMAERDEGLFAEQMRISSGLAGEISRSSGAWTNEGLASAALEVFERAESELSTADLRKVLGIPELEAADFGASIYKCPFLTLKRSRSQVKPALGEGKSEFRARFTHRVFFEYFATKGIVAKLESALREAGRDRPVEPGAFHDLVLNVDMHKFLRDLTIKLGAKLGWFEEPEDLWYQETGRAYGLRDRDEEWRNFGGLTEERRKTLNEIRIKLLDGRSGVSPNYDELPKYIGLFLELESKGKPRLAPRYLIPNYEAVAVCLLKVRADANTRSRFSELLKEHIDDAVGRLRRAEPQRQVFELLVERILDIGRRYRFPWVKDWSSQDLVESLKEAELRGPSAIVINLDKKCRRRISSILGEIGRLTLF